MHQAGVNIPGLNRHPTKNADVPFSKLLIHISIFQNTLPCAGTTTSLALPKESTDVRLREVEGKTGAGTFGAKMRMLML